MKGKTEVQKKKKRRRSKSSRSSSCSPHRKQHRSPSKDKEKKVKRKSRSSSSSSSRSSSSFQSSSSSESSNSDSKSMKKDKHKRKKVKEREEEEKKKKKKEKRKKQKRMKKKMAKLKKQMKKDIPTEMAPRKAEEAESSLVTWQSDNSVELGPVMTDEQKARFMTRRPITKEEWDARQSVIRRVLDPETGRTRLVKGDGEILEEIVSKDRHKEINTQATLYDGLSYQSRMGLNK